MNGLDQLGGLVQGIQALITLAVGVVTVIALTRKQPPIETTVRRVEDALREDLDGIRQLVHDEVGDLYREIKKNLDSTTTIIRDQENRLSKLEGVCSTVNANGKSCVKR